MKQKLFLSLLFVLALFALTSCDSLWSHESEQAVEISFTIPQEWLDSFKEEAEASQMLRSISGGPRLLSSNVDTSITAHASIIDAETGDVLAEIVLNLGDNLDDTIRLGPLYIVGKTVYAQVELTQYGHLSRVRQSDPLTVIDGTNRVTFNMGEAEKVTWKLNFDSNGGTDVVSQQSVLHLEKATLPAESASMAVPSGKEFFLGWTKTRNGNDWVVFPYEVTESDTLYARWANPGEYTELSVADNGPDELSIADGASATGEVKIPPMMRGKPITKVGNAFEDNVNITSVVFSKFIIETETHSFSNCENLSSVTLNEGIKTLVNYTFDSCPNLTDIVIPSTVSTIESLAFELSGITKLNVHSNNKTYESIDNNIYTKGINKTFVLYAPGKNDTSFTIPNYVAKIGEYAFHYNSVLTEILIPTSVTSIDTSAFRACIKLTEVTIPNKVTSIGAQAFENCSVLENVYIHAVDPPTLTVIDIFNGVASSLRIHVPAGSGDAYRSAQGWSDHADKIQEM